jgi:hypothetical protein
MLYIQIYCALIKAFLGAETPNRWGQRYSYVNFRNRHKIAKFPQPVFIWPPSVM